ncbi:uncharacterized protein PV07_11869 [Cladophialophora immunda]|uniref:Zn(2)-C6 fungal-type domain-containing protein n=1 Tax=Cladophialophora immunda TaxID=569365 RepID=A0A0D2CJE9_9EURO|nr:uncharacterized protein PV07_11869 [Cladophialophora immunda]KIW23689.1 hypothetical protein PV07_11869 [Cladophialophora immunda]OQV03398.1 Fungal specific transcription factor domain-containing protein [Cladophialophora immunda]
MDQSTASMTLSASQGLNAVRKKTPGACEKCRERRVKCNGIQPCDQCLKKDFQCTYSFASTSGNEALSEKLDLVLSRLSRVEEALNQNAQLWNGHNAKILPAQKRRGGLAQLNPQSGCVEYYGGTSAFVVASSLGKRVRQLEEISSDCQPSKLRRGDLCRRIPGTSTKDMRELDLYEVTSFCDYVVPPTELHHHHSLREDVADRHLDNFFKTIHIFLPVFDEDRFRERYHAVRPLFGDNRLFTPKLSHQNQPQFVSLLYAVLALGALYEDEKDDSSSWASWYFVQAQEILGRYLDAIDIQLVQAAMLMGAYAQHAIKPNLAYVLNGLAARLAFSIGIHIESVPANPRFDAEEARRTWWLIFIQEVELSLDSGRPMSVRMSDMTVKYPTIESTVGKHIRPCHNQVAFIPLLAEIAKIIQMVLQLADDAGDQHNSKAAAETIALLCHLEAWRAELPTYLRFDSPEHDFNSNPGFSPTCWEARQQSSLRIHYNLAVIILLRKSLPKPSKRPDGHNIADASTNQAAICIRAARDMIQHVHELFRLAPSLRRWSYYCFYCLQATLVLLTNITNDNSASCHQDPHAPNYLSTGHDASGLGLSRSIEDDLHLCEMSVQILQQIELKASRRCAEHVSRFLEKWRAKRLRKVVSSAASSLSTHPGPHTIEKTPRQYNEDSPWGIRPETSHPGSINSQISDTSRQHPNRLSMASTATPYVTDLFKNLSASYPSPSRDISVPMGVSAVDGNEAATDATKDTSPMSLGGLQADLYNALYHGCDQAEGLNFLIDNTWSGVGWDDQGFGFDDGFSTGTG